MYQDLVQEVEMKQLHVLCCKLRMARPSFPVVGHYLSSYQEGQSYVLDRHHDCVWTPEGLVASLHVVSHLAGTKTTI